MQKTAIINGKFITMEPDLSIKDNVTLIIDNGRISELDHVSAELLEQCEIIDGSHRLYLPGLVNTHGHVAMSLIRGYSDDISLQDWFAQIWPVEAKFDDEAVKWGSLLAIAEMLKGGTTCFVDMYDRMDQVAVGVVESGIRACLTRGIIGLGSAQEWLAKIKEAVSFTKNWHGEGNSRITTMMAPHAPYTCPPAVLEKIVDAAHELELPIHTHLSETSKEVIECEAHYGIRPIAYLEKYGVFTRPCLVAHAVHVNEQEIDTLAAYRVHISHNPGSNLKLASGIAPVPQFLVKGLLVGIGTDSAASNNNLDMLEEIRLTALIHKGINQNPTAIPAAKALQMGTCDGARALWLNELGILKPGMKADIIAIDIDQPHFYPHGNFISNVVYSASAQDITDVWVDGKQLMRNRVLLTLDEEQIKYEFKRCYKKLF